MVIFGQRCTSCEISLRVSARRKQKHLFGRDGALSAGLLRAILPLGALAAAALAVGGCEKSPPETRLERAGEALGQATTELANLDTRIEQTEALLNELRASRREQRDRVRTLEEVLDARATDVALFRAVQKALLDDDRLQAAAIAVTVEEGVVSLHGIVRTQAAKNRAVALASQTAGVHDVVSMIQIDDPQTASSGRP